MMPPSYERVDYRVRPAKSIERKMLCEAFVKLGKFCDLTEYKYVGFGSIFFSDFTLIHKFLGIKDLISIEEQEKDKKRFEFNCPYKFIELYFGHSNDVLPALEWTKKLIIWLDYDKPLEERVLTDIGTFLLNAKSGSIILLTIDVDPCRLGSPGKERYNKFVDLIGEEKIPLDIEDKALEKLDKENFPRECRQIINNEIEEIILKKNGGIEEDDKLEYKQLFNFLYKDGSAQMLTVGGIIYSQKDKEKIQKCNFEGLDFIKSRSLSENLFCSGQKIRR